MTLEYAEPKRDGKSYGVLGKMGPEPNTLESEQVWLTGLYDGDNLYRFELDSGDAAIGDPPLAPSRVIAALARTLVEIEPKANGGRGDFRDLGARWPLQLKLAWSGARIGGQLTSVTPVGRFLYGPEKACFASLLLRAGRQSGDRELTDAGREVVEFTLDAAGGQILPLGKLDGQYFSRLHSGVAELAGSTAGAGKAVRRDGDEKAVGHHP